MMTNGTDKVWRMFWMHYEPLGQVYVDVQKTYNIDVAEGLTRVEVKVDQ
jgi:hypothetical protein